MEIKTLFSKNTVAVLFVSGALALAACGTGSETSTNSDSTTNTQTEDANASNQTAAKTAVATLSGTTTDTSVTGNVRFEPQGDGKVKMTLEITVEKMAGKSVAVHLHEHSECGDHGNHAGGHWNPTGENHGKWGEGSFHSGDFGNITLDASGKGTLEVSSDRWTVGGDEKTNVVNRTVLVHSGVDDLKTQPSGNSGSRIGCGIIQ